MKIFKNLLLGAAIASTINTSSQNNYKGWFTSNSLIDFSGTTPIKKVFGSTPDPVSALNSAYDSEGKLLFYISGNSIINKFNNIIGNLTAPLGFSIAQVDEISIVPFPNNNGCQNKFYVLYKILNNSGNTGNIRFGTVDMNANNFQGNLTISSTDISYTGLTNPHIAVGKINSNGKRFIYVQTASSLGTIDVLEASNTGIVNLGPINLTTSTFQLNNKELELSNNGDNLVTTNFASGSTSVIIIPLNTSTGKALTGAVNTFIYTGANISGLEFDNSGNKLYFSATGIGIHYRDLIANTTNLIASTSSLADSHLEKSYNGTQIICANANTIRGIDVATNTLNSWSIAYSLPNVNSVITMPNQIDGENYDLTNTINIDALSFTQTTNDVWTAASNPILTALQNITIGNLTSLPRIRWGGDLTVNNAVNLTIQNMEFQQATNTEIKMNGGCNVNIIGCYLHAHTCGLMWKGINVNNNNSANATYLTMQKSSGKGGPRTRVENAIKGVYADESNSLIKIITTCDFIDNEKSVVILNGNPNNEFYNCSYKMLNPLLDQTYGSSNGYGSLKYGITGIEAQLAGGVAQTIGSGAFGGNLFEGGQLGIDAFANSINAEFNTFQNIKGTGIRSNANFANGIKIVSRYNTFNTNFYDIDCFFGNDLTVQNCNLNNCSGNSINWNYNYDKTLIVGGDKSPSGNGSISDANLFNGCNWSAVYCLDNEAANTNIQINYNTIQNAPWAYGVFLNQTYLTSANQTFGKFSIANNTIHNLAYPIQIQNVKGNIDPTKTTADYNNYNPEGSNENNFANIELNDIILSTTYDAFAIGIKNYNSPQTKIYNNTIVSDDPGNWQNSGIDASDSKMSFIFKNQITAGRGIIQRLDMNNANNMCNDLNNCGVGIQLNWEWLRSSDSQHGLPYIYNRRNNFSGTIYSGYDMEVYYSNVANNQWCNPYTNQIAYTGVSGNIIYENTSPNPVCFPCVTCRTSNNTTVNTDNYNLNAGKLSASNAQNKFNTYKTWYNKFDKKTKNKNLIITEASLVENQNLTKLVTVNEMLTAKNYTTAISTLQTLNNSNVYESNLANVYGIIANKKSQYNRKATNAEKAMLIAIAQEHPIEAGPAVYNARAILHADFNLNYTMADSSAVAALPKLNPTNNAKVVNNSYLPTEVSIYPNPANNKVVFMLNNNNVTTYSVINILGLVVAKGTFNTSVELNLNNIPNGVYIVNFNEVNTGTLSTKTLIIDK